MSKKTVYTCDRCGKEVQASLSEAYRIPSDFVSLHLSGYDRDKQPCGEISVEVCETCAQNIRDTFDHCMKATIPMIMIKETP